MLMYLSLFGHLLGYFSHKNDWHSVYFLPWKSRGYYPSYSRGYHVYCSTGPYDPNKRPPNCYLTYNLVQTTNLYLLSIFDSKSNRSSVLLDIIFAYQRHRKHQEVLKKYNPLIIAQRLCQRIQLLHVSHNSNANSGWLENVVRLTFSPWHKYTKYISYEVGPVCTVVSIFGDITKRSIQAFLTTHA